MKKGGGKGKGGAFERKLCKRLSLWVSGGKNEDLFWRSAMSGGRATVAAKKGVELRRQAGDISAVSPEGHALTDYFYVEAKHLKNLSVRSFFLHGTGLLAQHYKTTRDQAMGYGKIPLLIARQNNLPILLVCPRGMSHLLVGRDPYYDAVRTSQTMIHPMKCEVCLLDDVLMHPFNYKPNPHVENIKREKGNEISSRGRRVRPGRRSR